MKINQLNFTWDLCQKKPQPVGITSQTHQFIKIIKANLGAKQTPDSL